MTSRGSGQLFSVSFLFLRKINVSQNKAIMIVQMTTRSTEQNNEIFHQQNFSTELKIPNFYLVLPNCLWSSQKCGEERKCIFETLFGTNHFFNRTQTSAMHFYPAAFFQPKLEAAKKKAGQDFPLTKGSPLWRAASCPRWRSPQWKKCAIFQVFPSWRRRVIEPNRRQLRAFERDR